MHSSKWKEIDIVIKLSLQDMNKLSALLRFGWFLPSNKSIEPVCIIVCYVPLLYLQVLIQSSAFYIYPSVLFASFLTSPPTFLFPFPIRAPP